MSTSSDILKNKFVTAMKRSLGNVAQSSQLTGVSRNTHYKWMKNDPDYKEKIDNLVEDIGDIVETQLYKKIMGYTVSEDKIFHYKGKPVIIPTNVHYQPDTASIIFYCKTKLKRRGYIETNITITKEEADELENLTEEQLEEYIQKHAPKDLLTGKEKKDADSKTTE